MDGHTRPRAVRAWANALACFSPTGRAAMAARALLRHWIMSFGARLWGSHASYSESRQRCSKKLSVRARVCVRSWTGRRCFPDAGLYQIQFFFRRNALYQSWRMGKRRVDGWVHVSVSDEHYDGRCDKGAPGHAVCARGTVNLLAPS